MHRAAATGSAGLTAVTLTADQAAAVADGRVTWAGGRVVVAPPADPEPDPIEARVAALETELAATKEQAATAEKVAAALVDKGVLTSKDITDAVVAEPVDEEAVVKP